MHAIPNIFKEEKKHPGQVLTSVTAEPKGLRVPCLAHFTPLLKPAVLPSNKERNFPVDVFFFQRTAQQDELSLYSLPFKNPVTTNTGCNPYLPWFNDKSFGSRVCDIILGG